MGAIIVHKLVHVMQTEAAYEVASLMRAREALTAETICKSRSKTTVTLTTDINALTTTSRSSNTKSRPLPPPHVLLWVPTIKTCASEKIQN